MISITLKFLFSIFLHSIIWKFTICVKPSIKDLLFTYPFQIVIDFLGKKIEGTEFAPFLFYLYRKNKIIFKRSFVEKCFKHDGSEFDISY